jgi:hypothetical protein
VGPRTDLDYVWRRKSCPYGDSSCDPSAVQPVATRYIDYAKVTLRLTVMMGLSFVRVTVSSIKSVVSM